MPRAKSIVTAGFGVFLFLLTPHATAEGTWTEGSFEIHVFQIGQGDSQLIVSPSVETLLIDVPEMSWNSRRCAGEVAEKIHKVMGINFSHLDYIIATHLHLDHIGYAGKGGIWSLIEEHGFTVGKLIDRDAGVWEDANDNGEYDDGEIVWHNAGTVSGTAQKWLEYVTDPDNAATLNREIAVVGSSEQIDLGDDVEVTIIQSDATGVKMEDGQTDVAGNHVGEQTPPSENDYSITLKITFNELDYVTGSDTDGEYETSGLGTPITMLRVSSPRA